MSRTTAVAKRKQILKNKQTFVLFVFLGLPECPRNLYIDRITKKNLSSMKKRKKHNQSRHLLRRQHHKKRNVKRWQETRLLEDNISTVMNWRLKRYEHVIRTNFTAILQVNTLAKRRKGRQSINCSGNVTEGWKIHRRYSCINDDYDDDAVEVSRSSKRCNDIHQIIKELAEINKTICINVSMLVV